MKGEKLFKGPVPLDQRDRRRCLGLNCSAWFLSTHKGHRKCPRCRSREAGSPLSRMAIEGSHRTGN